MADRFPTAAIYSFEPVPATFAELKRNTANLPQVTTFNQAMGGQVGTATIHLYQTSLHSSMLTAGRTPAESVEVAVTTADAFCAARPVGVIDLLKVDVEGFEPQVLDGAAGLLAAGRVRFAYLECRFADAGQLPQADFFDLHARFVPLGYCLAGVYAESFNLTGGALHANVLFAHRPSLPASVPGAVHNITTYG